MTNSRLKAVGVSTLVIALLLLVVGTNAFAYRGIKSSPFGRRVEAASAAFRKPGAPILDDPHPDFSLLVGGPGTIQKDSIQTKLSKIDSIVQSNLHKSFFTPQAAASLNPSSTPSTLHTGRSSTLKSSEYNNDEMFDEENDENDDDDEHHPHHHRPTKPNPSKVTRVMEVIEFRPGMKRRPSELFADLRKVKKRVAGSRAMRRARMMFKRLVKGAKGFMRRMMRGMMRGGMMRGGMMSRGRDRMRERMMMRGGGMLRGERMMREGGVLGGGMMVVGGPQSVPGPLQSFWKNIARKWGERVGNLRSLNVKPKKPVNNIIIIKAEKPSKKKHAVKKTKKNAKKTKKNAKKPSKRVVVVKKKKTKKVKHNAVKKPTKKKVKNAKHAAAKKPAKRTVVSKTKNAVKPSIKQNKAPKPFKKVTHKPSKAKRVVVTKKKTPVTKKNASVKVKKNAVKNQPSTKMTMLPSGPVKVTMSSAVVQKAPPSTPETEEEDHDDHEHDHDHDADHDADHEHDAAEAAEPAAPVPKPVQAAAKPVKKVENPAAQAPSPEPDHEDHEDHEDHDHDHDHEEEEENAAAAAAAAAPVAAAAQKVKTPPAAAAAAPRVKALRPPRLREFDAVRGSEGVAMAANEMLKLREDEVDVEGILTPASSGGPFGPRRRKIAAARMKYKGE
ncbi:hypothetical protein HDU67_008994 [Dinochytrium kinnereticum]|nr:hypothetical protein HDU67_008994 [Dinochytrium kinnereticum]